MTDPHDEDHQISPIDLVDDPIGAHPKAPQTTEFAFEDTSGGRVRGKAIDGADPALPITLDDTP